MSAQTETKSTAADSLQGIVSLLLEACRIYREASQQGHSTHWDDTMQHGRGCPECIRARELRAKADAIMERANGKPNHAGAETQPRVRALLNAMITALDRDDADIYWVAFGKLLSLHEEMMKSPKQANA